MGGKRKHINDVQAYLDRSGILEHGSYSEIEALKRKYWNEVKRLHKVELRKKMHGFMVYLNDSEHSAIVEIAKAYDMSRTNFIKQAAISVVTKKQIYPNVAVINEVKEVLARTYNVIQQLQDDEVLPDTIGTMLLNKIEALESHVLTILSSPQKDIL